METDDPTVVPPGMVRSAAVELTSRCNLRCAYCGNGNAVDDSPRDMSPEHRRKAKDLLRGRRASVSLSVNGEITHIRDWRAVLDEFLADNDFAFTNAVTNLAKPLSFDDAIALTRLDALSVSLDTVDAALLHRTRRGADFGTIVSNIGMLRAAAIHRGRTDFRCGIIAVIHESSVFGIDRLVALAIALGVTNLKLQDLGTDFSDRHPELGIGHISRLPPDRLREAAMEVMKAGRLAAAHGLPFSFYPGIADTFSPLWRDGEPSPIESIEVETARLGRHRFHAKPVAPGMTRHCLMPWTMMMLMADGAVRGCCGKYGSVSTWTDADSIEAIANTPEIRQMRRELLSGELSDACRYCGMMPETDPKTLEAAVREAWIR